MYHVEQQRVGGADKSRTINQAQALEYFEQFINATSLKNILGYFRTMCEILHLKPTYYPLFYPKLKAMLNSWKAKAIWKKLDSRSNHKCYGKAKIGEKSRVLIIGGGPCGLRTAIEAQLLGCKVVVVEKRDRLSRNNVLHLWPFVIEDLRALGAKKFFGKFCAGSIDHISIRQLQCILLKVALILGVEIHTEVSFENLIEPNHDEKIGWRAQLKPQNHPVSQYEFDVIIGADGKRNTLAGFKRKEFRGKLAIAITANFINKRTEAEARVEEISGVAFIFNQKFFKDLYQETGIDLENIVYYKDDTHYFVMTAKKPSLIEKGVILQDLADTERLLGADNVNREALLNYAKEAAEFSTNYQMPQLEFAVNHYGQPDVAMFDFTSMFAAENASKVLERSGYQLLMILVGDSLLEPFWPTGSGCARGFLSSLDAAWAIRSWSLAKASPLEVLAERESIYRLLAQTTPDNLNKDWKSYTLDPSTRYPNFNRSTVSPHQIVSLYNTDDIQNIEKMGRNLENTSNVSRKRRRDMVDSEILIDWVKQQVKKHNELEITDLTSIFRSGKVLCAIIHHYRPDLIDYSSLTNNEPSVNNQLAIDILEKDIGIPPIMTGAEITETSDNLALAAYLTQVYDVFRSEIPHVKHPKLELPESKYTTTSFKTIIKEPSAMMTSNLNSRPSSKHKRHIEGILATKSANIERKTRKRKTFDKAGSVAAIQKRFEEESNSKSENRMSKRQQQRKLHAEHFLKSMQMLAANAKPDYPFEDYSIFVYRQTARNFEDRVKDLEKKFTYIPDYDNKPPSLVRGNTDEDFVAKIKSIEQGWQGTQVVEKKPKDLLRKIGKIETSDWNIKEIEKKIKENKMGKPILRDKEKVPKWSREQFVARQTKMEKLDRQDSSEAKYADIDKNIKYLDMKLKEGTNRDLGQNKVATITEKLAKQIPEPTEPVVAKTTDKPVILPSYSGSEFCHFCSKRVYLMERLSAEGRFFHHGCFKCQYCKAQLRLGSYAFDKDGIYGHKFFCLHHYGMQGETRSTTKVSRKPSQKGVKPAAKKILSGVSGVDLLDRVRTPERVEFSNLSRCSSDQEDSLSQMDEDEWTDRNFGASTAEVGSSDDDDSSSYSETDSDDEEAYEEALEEPATKEGTMKWAERMSKRHYSKQYKSDSDPYGSSDSSSYYENSSDDDDSNTATEGEEEIRARELRLQEVRLEPPIIQADTGTDTEVTCNLECSEDLNIAFNEILNSNDLGLSKKSSSNSVNTADFDSALEDNLDINSNNISEKNKSEPVLIQSAVDSGEESVTISKSDSNSNITVIQVKANERVNDLTKQDDLDLAVEKTFVATDTAGRINSSFDNEECHKKNSNPTGVSKTFFSDEFVPKFQCSEPEPLLIIKRTPSKINLPKEVGKPKVAVNTNIENARKYFGTPQKSSLRRSSTLKSDTKPKITKQASLCEDDKKKIIKTQNSFNFEPEDEDLKNIDDYIENLLKDENELMKPIDPNKFKIVDEPQLIEEGSKCDSIDDLLEALEIETGEDVLDQSGIKKTDEKIDKLLKWLDEVDHREEVTQSTSVINDSIGKYDNLEHLLRYEKHAAPVSKLAKTNIKYFDDLLSGKHSDEKCNDSKLKSGLVRSKTEINFNKPRSSIDLDAVKKVNIKNVLKKFESIDKENEDLSSEKSSSNDPCETVYDKNKKPSLTRSKTEIHFKKARTSVDLDAVSNVDIKKVLKKFEKMDDDCVTPNIRIRINNSFNAQKSSVETENINKQTEQGISDEKNEMVRLKNISNDVVTNKKKGKEIDKYLSRELLDKECIDLQHNLNKLKEMENKNFVSVSELSNSGLNENYFNMQVKVNYEQYHNDVEIPDIKELELNKHENLESQKENEVELIAENIDNVDSYIDKQKCNSKSEDFPTEVEIPSLEMSKISEIKDEWHLEGYTEFEKHLTNSEHTTYNQNIIPNEKLNEIIDNTNISCLNNEENTQVKFNSNSEYCNIKNLEDKLHELKNDSKSIIGNLEPNITVDRTGKEYPFDKFENDKENLNEDTDNSLAVNLNLLSQDENINMKNTNLNLEISNLKNKTVEYNKLQNENIINLDKFVSNSETFGATEFCTPPIPARTKHSCTETPPQRPQRKRSLEQRNRESIERTRYIPRQEKLRDLEKIKKEIVTSHHSPKVHKMVVNNLNSNSDSNDKECSIQRISQNLGSGLVNNHVQAMVKEVISDDNSSDISSEVQNSATEISTDSEFAQDDPTPTSEIPAIVLNDLYVNMSRGSSSNRPKKIQVTSGFIQTPNGKAPKQDIELNLTPLVSPAPSLRKITPSIKPPTEAYALNRTQSTGGIATKVSLELKKRYLLGESIGSGSIQKSGSASTLDTKLKSFCSNISDCQKLLKPASEISASMQTFCNKLDEHTSPILSPLSANKQLPVESEENNENGKVEVLPPPDLINVTLSEKKEETVEQIFENETEGRPRSPLHETSLIVPEIDWKKIGHSVESTSSSSSSSSSDEQINTPNLSHNKIPTVEIHNADDPPDDIKKLWDNHSVASDSVKSIASDKKQLNQPKTLPGLINDIPVGTMKKKSKESGYKKISPQDDKSSECSTPISGGEEITAAFTETELSDWARDGGVSDDLEGMAFDLNIENDMQQKVPELSILNHVCGKTDQEKQVNNEQQSANFDSIEFMDTCTESNSEEGIVDSIGYNLFKNEDITEDSLNLSINENIQEKNTCMDDSKIKNSGYCVLATESSNFGGEVINLKPSDIEQLKHNQNLTEREEDSLVVIETTTEENTCSDSTVKNITEIPVDANKLYETNIQKQRLEEKLVQLKKEKKETMLKAQIDKECDKEKDGLDDYKIAEMKNFQFEEHCQRLQSKVDFGNVKDSIDIRKSRRKSRDSPQKPDFIQEEQQYFGSSNSLKEITLNLTPTIKTPEQIYKKEVIEKERDVNQKLVQEMVMSKMRAENKALERRVRTRPTHNLNRGFQLSKSATSDMANVNNVSNLENQGVSNILKQTACNFVLKEKEPIIELNALQKSRTSPNIPEDNIRKVVCDLHVPVVPPRSRDLKNSTDKLRNDARVRAKMLSNDELGLSPEDKLQKFREKSKMYDGSISKENSEFQLFPMSLNKQVIPRRKILQRPLSEYSPKISENRKSFSTVCDDNKQLKMCHSESNLLDMKNGKAKGKEVSPKKGIKFIKIMDLFSKKSPKGLFSKISAKSKDTSKEKKPINKHARVKSFPETSSQINSAEVPPPVPPLPLCYTEQLLRNSEESSEDELKRSKQTPCETGDASGIFDDSLSSLTERHPHKRNRRSIREAQLKRHRMAQEIQRKLEETEVKTKELEERGVVIEKNLRGELSQSSSKLESDLLQEWFDIMRDRTELRRYEKELIIRAQELELEDRHARLQHQLRKRLSEENKTEEDKEADCRIINEMLEIVSKRDSLTALLEEDRLRYLSEDRDFEEQMLAKDLYLTPNGKSMKNN